MKKSLLYVLTGIYEFFLLKKKYTHYKMEKKFLKYFKEYN